MSFEQEGQLIVGFGHGDMDAGPARGAEAQLSLHSYESGEQVAGNAHLRIGLQITKLAVFSIRGYASPCFAMNCSAAWRHFGNAGGFRRPECP